MSFAAANLRAAAVARDICTLDASRVLVGAMPVESVDGERLELLRAVSDSLTANPAAPFSSIYAELSLLGHVENQWAGPPASMI